MRTMLKSKLHRARVTRCDLEYEGSITIDRDLLKAADILPFEQVQVLNLNNGARFATYAIEGEAGSGEIGLNGAAARCACKGDLVIILTYEQVAEDQLPSHMPKLVYVDEKNRITSVKQAIGAISF
ncbi:aspartate 1-decarboxylase [Dehalogenimonas alkenigignens]|jgi:aspartate 1-decarboxylase|uniref:Aspartate 1-decarboxylase n=1 Tax=Dehalogenimonas alkenigignens TaxID=1217799 RepID=A0A0W0GJI9_9CHLR|nr:aspartate 1-decarboxylase [Dehalogenimonas alkenigignens]KTB48724.1 L-aspartate 1-decarboxylase [Dehalogenimonas alkenigignens]PVV84860.1 aspartate 1-decarboxylase [Dehalogenimonas alkenigignens]